MAASGHAPQPHNDALEIVPSKRRELTVFLVTTLVLIPGAAVAVVGAFGLIIWISQIFLGPPGPPA